LTFKTMLRLGGYLNFAIALAHIVLFLGMLFAIDQLNAVTRTVGVHIGAPSGGWVGWIKLLLMIIAVATFVSLLGLYRLSGAGHIRRLPLLRPGLIFTTVVFTFHGAYQILEKVGKYEALVTGRDVHPLLALIPLWKLTIGILYLVGTVGLWKTLAPDKGTSPTRRLTR
jgi:hypothetical protein